MPNRGSKPAYLDQMQKVFIGVDLPVPRVPPPHSPPQRRRPARDAAAGPGGGGAGQGARGSELADGARGQVHRRARAQAPPIPAGASELCPTDWADPTDHHCDSDPRLNVCYSDP